MMFLTFVTTFGLLAVSGGIYLVLHRRFGWVELWNPLAPSPPQSFASLLPLEDVQNQCYVCTDGSLVAGWELTGIDADMRAPTAVEHDVNALGMALNLIDPGVEVLVQIRRSQYSADTGATLAQAAMARAARADCGGRRVPRYARLPVPAGWRR